MSINTICLVPTVVFGAWSAINIATKFNVNKASSNLLKAFPSIISKVSEAYDVLHDQPRKNDALWIINSARKTLIFMNTKWLKTLTYDDTLGLQNLHVCSPFMMDQSIPIQLRTEAYTTAQALLKEAESNINTITNAIGGSYTTEIIPLIGFVSSCIAYYKTYDPQEVKPAGADGSHDNHNEL